MRKGVCHLIADHVTYSQWHPSCDCTLKWSLMRLNGVNGVERSPHTAPRADDTTPGMPIVTIASCWDLPKTLTKADYSCLYCFFLTELSTRTLSLPWTLLNPFRTLSHYLSNDTSSHLATQARVLQQVIDLSISRALSNTMAEVTSLVDASVRTALSAQTQPSPGLPPSLAATPSLTPSQQVIVVNLIWEAACI